MASEKTSRRAALAASKVLSDGSGSKSSKSAAGSALSQSRSNKVTSSSAASAASKTLRDSSTSKSSKTSAGSALTQRPSKKK